MLSTFSYTCCPCACLLWKIFIQVLCSFLFIYFFLILFYFAKYRNESATGIHVFPILNPLPSSPPYHPSGSSQCTSPKHPVSCIKPWLATRFIHDSIHVSMPFSQIFPPSPSPTESIRLFYASVSLLLMSTELSWQKFLPQWNNCRVNKKRKGKSEKLKVWPSVFASFQWM